MTSPADSERARRLFATAAQNLPELYSDFELAPLGGGYLHDAVLVTHAEGRGVYKLLNTELEEFAAPPIGEIVANTRRAGEAGVGARLIAEFPQTPAIVLEYIDAPPLEIAAVQRPETLARVVDAAHRLHVGAEPFTSRFDGFEWFDRWRSLCLQRGYADPEIGPVLAAGMQRMRIALAANPPADVPCHGDLLPGNILDSAAGIRLIDYDYAGMAEPAWDLGGIAAENSLSVELVEFACRRYWGEATGSREIARVRAYAIVFHIALGSLVWALRGAIPDLMPDEVWGELIAEFEERWEIAATALADPDFEGLLATAQ
jgi:hypothetical protein